MPRCGGGRPAPGAGQETAGMPEDATAPRPGAGARLCAGGVRCRAGGSWGRDADHQGPVVCAGSGQCRPARVRTGLQPDAVVGGRVGGLDVGAGRGEQAVCGARGPTGVTSKKCRAVRRPEGAKAPGSPASGTDRNVRYTAVRPNRADRTGRNACLVRHLSGFRYGRYAFFTTSPRGCPFARDPGPPGAGGPQGRTPAFAYPP